MTPGSTLGGSGLDLAAVPPEKSQKKPAPAERPSEKRTDRSEKRTDRSEKRTDRKRTDRSEREKPAARPQAEKKGAKAPPAAAAPKPKGESRQPAAPKPPKANKKPKETIDPRSGRIAIVGQPNVGKSTLLNALLGQKLAITTSKPGTTRTVLLGVAEHRSEEGELTQLALLDTPGLEQPRSVLGRALVEEAQGALDGVDAILFIVDVEQAIRSRGLDLADSRILTAIKAQGAPFVIALNKVDRVRDKERLFPLLAKLHETSGAAAIVPLSARRELEQGGGSGIDGVVRELRAFLRPGLGYEEGTLTDKPERFFVAELVREAILDRTQQEVPHGVAVSVDEWIDEGKHLRVGCTIVVDKEGHKGILIGAKGQMLKEIGEAARTEIEALLGRHVFLRTFVKVMPGWTKDEGKVRRAVREGSPE